MPLLGSAAMLLSFDIADEAIAEHDDWHTHEHLAERLSIPGFLRGTRWVALQGRPRYLVVYEVAELATLTSAAYLERLNNPSAWTSRVMPHYRGMSRGLCSVSGSFGLGTGHAAALLRFKPQRGSAESLRRWLLQEVLPPLPSEQGVGSVHLLERAITPQMTHEQRIRGADAGIDWALLLTGYSEEALANLVRHVLEPARLEEHGASDVLNGGYRIDYSLAHAEVGRRQAPAER
jgi:hypothetical protein